MLSDDQKDQFTSVLSSQCYLLPYSAALKYWRYSALLRNFNFPYIITRLIHDCNVCLTAANRFPIHSSFVKLLTGAAEG